MLIDRIDRRSLMIVGYARTSTYDQQHGLRLQLDELAAAQCERVFQEQASSVGKRDGFAAVLQFVRDGDVLVVTKLDRLARSVSDLWAIVRKLEGKGATLRILNLSLDTATATGKLMLSTLGAVAEFERDIMLERQKDGIAKAKAAGTVFGRKPTARAMKSKIIEMKLGGVGASEIARSLRISRASVYRHG